MLIFIFHARIVTKLLETVVSHLNIIILNYESNFKALKATTKVFILERYRITKRDTFFCSAVLDINTVNDKQQ